MDQNDLSTQTDESLGWAAEGKNLAVDVPDKAVTLKDAATFVASMTPIIGDAMLAKEIWDETQKEDPNWLLVGALGGATAIGLIPGVGDAAASLIKKGARNALDTAKRVEVDPTALGSGLGNVRLKSKDTDNTLIPSKTTGDVSNPVSKADDIIFEWEKGNIGNAELRSQLKGQGFEINNKRIGPNLAGGDLEVVDLKTGTIATWENLSRTKDVKLSLFNEGGLAMDDQMEAVFKSSRTDEIDPVSGNEVPTGSLPEEVRDDIPAQLSEGEYVVPADVVRYYGVKHFEDMRAEAKQGWDGMEQNDRIGGEPVGMEMGGDDLPFDVSELQIVDDGQPEQPMMNKGGYISGYAEGGSAIPTTGGVTYVMYVNSEGATMQIPFFNGVPMSVIPEGFYVQGEAPEESVASLPQPSRNDDDGGSLSPPEAVDYKNLTAVELAKMVEQQNSKTAKLVSTGISMANPLFGLLAKFAFSDMARRTENEIKRRIDSGEYQDNQGFYEGLLEETAEKKPSFLKGLFDEITGKDTEYTGELLKEDTDAAVSLALSDTPISEDRQTVLSGLSNPEPGAEMSDLEAREWRTKLGYTPETTTPEVTESDVAKAGELDLPEITTTELEPSDPYVAEVAEAQVSDPRFFDVATPGLDDTPRASESDYFPSPSVSVSDSDKDSDSGSGSSLMDQTIAGARKSAANRKKYTEAGIQYGGKLITNSDGTTRAVPTYRAEDVKKAGINPGGR